MFSMMNTITQALYELSNSVGHNLLNCDDFVERLLKCQNISEMKNVLDDIFHSIEHELTLIGEIQKDKFIENIENYIVQNYMNYNLNISNIAEYLDMNPTYLSRKFKEQTGENLLDYINKIRISKAKNLLKNPKLSINRIAELLVYHGSKIFVSSEVNAAIPMALAKAMAYNSPYQTDNSIHSYNSQNDLIPILINSLFPMISILLLSTSKRTSSYTRFDFLCISFLNKYSCM